MNLYNSQGLIFLLALFLNMEIANGQGGTDTTNNIKVLLDKDGSLTVNVYGAKDQKDILIVEYQDSKSEKKADTFYAKEYHIDPTEVRLEHNDMAYKIDKDGIVSFVNHYKLDRPIRFCQSCKCLVAGSENVGNCLEASDEKSGTDDKKNGLLSDFPFPPQFSPKSGIDADLFPDSKRGYYHLVIDADADLSRKKNNTLYIKNLGKDIATYKIANCLRVNSSLSVFIKNYNFSNFEDINLTINGTDYYYSQALDGLYPGAVDSIQGGKSDSILAAATPNEDTLKLIKRKLQFAKNYLEGYISLNINDIVLLNQYKSDLAAYYGAHSTVFDKDAANLLSQILTWYPQLVSLTPIALTIPDNDEVEIELKIRDKKGPERKYDVGNYRIKNGASVTAGGKGSLFFTNLKNKEAYIDSADHRAKLDGSHRLSIGIGASGIVSFRTGSAYTPTINLGFFVPLGEDLSPFGHIGPGINYGTKKVGLNLSAGLAFGKVNAIKTWYKDVDMRTIQNLDPMGITYKEWKLGWSASFGLSFNIAK